MLNDLGNRDDLEYLKRQVVRQKGVITPIPAWIEEISKKMDMRKVSPQKLHGLAEEVGLNNVNSYVAAGILRLMQDYEMLNFMGSNN